jgi:hypothetical protein
MGDWFETVVDPLVGPADAPVVADRVVAELIGAGLLKSVRTTCALGGPGYPPAPGVLGYLKDPDPLLIELQTNGLEVTARRSVHVNLSVKRIVCPGCGAKTENLSGLGWQDAVGEWYDGGEGVISCPACLQNASVAAWTHDPPCGFGNLAFTFWNWPPFEDAYWIRTPLQFIEAVVGHRCVLIWGKL